MAVFLSRTSLLMHAQQALQRGAHRRYIHLAQRGFQAWRVLHRRCLWNAQAEEKVLYAKQRKRRRYLRRCFLQFCAVRDEELEKRGVFEAMTPPPIIVHSRVQEGTRRPPLATSFCTEKEKEKRSDPLSKAQRQTPTQNKKQISQDQNAYSWSYADVVVGIDEHEDEGEGSFDISRDSLDDNDQVFAGLHHKVAEEVERHNMPDNPRRQPNNWTASDNDAVSDLSNAIYVNNDNANYYQRSKLPEARIQNTADLLTASNRYSNSKDVVENNIPNSVYDNIDIVSSSNNNRDTEALGKQYASCPDQRQRDLSSEVSSLATNESYLPTLQGMGTPSKAQLPLSYHLYTSGSGQAKDVPMMNDDGRHKLYHDSSSPSTLDGGSSISMTSANDTSDLHILRDSKFSLPLSHEIYLQQQFQQNSQECGEDDHKGPFVLVRSSTDDSCSYSSDDYSDSYSDRGIQLAENLKNYPKQPKPISQLITAEVNRRFRQQSLKRFVALFCKWKRQTQSSNLLRRVFSHAMELWENRYQRRFSSLPFHLLKHIMNIWKFAVSIAKQRRKDANNVHRALMFRGISLLSNCFVQWRTWTRVTQKKNKQLQTLQFMTKQVCFLGLIMLFQKLQVRYDKAREFNKQRSKRKVFAHLLEYAISSQETHSELKKRVDVIYLRSRWHWWVCEYKKALLEARTVAHASRRRVELKEAYWSVWKDKFILFQNHGLFAKTMEDIYIRKKAQVIYIYILFHFVPCDDSLSSRE